MIMWEHCHCLFYDLKQTKNQSRAFHFTRLLRQNVPRVRDVHLYNDRPSSIYNLSTRQRECLIRQVCLIVFISFNSFFLIFLYRDHHVFGTKIEKSETDIKG